MPTLSLERVIEAPIQRCFDLSRSIDLHIVSTGKSQETAIDGVTSGLIGLDETVTWRANHLFIWQTLKVKIIAFESPHYFCDAMVSGAFQEFQHHHWFSEIHPEKTLMQDRFEYKSPWGFLGTVADTLFLKAYMTRLLRERNDVIQQTAEGQDWERFLGDCEGVYS
jgi:ligand-binding SRPBCC domain-containing protein